MTQTLSQPIKVLLIVIGSLLLAMMLFYPSGYDQEIFNIGGDLVFKKGAVPYRDFLDTKPPLIFYIYGFALWVFGHHDWSIRAFDIVYHFITLFIFFRLIKKWSGSEKTAFISIFFYVILYTASGYWMTAQSETFALLPSLLIMNAAERQRHVEKRTLLHAIIIGVCSIILFLLKQTLIFVPIASAVYLLTRRDTKNHLRFILLSALSFMLLLGAFVGYMYAVGGLDWWVLAMKWVNDYANISPLLSAATIHDVYFLLFPTVLIATLSFSFMMFIVVFLYKRTLHSHEDDSISSAFSAHLLLQLAFGLFTVLLERKCFPYHYSRIFFAATPMIALGYFEVISKMKQYYSQKSISMKIALFSITSVLIFYSPVLHIITQPLRWTYLTITGAYIPTHGTYPLTDVKVAADLVRTKMKPNDEVFLWGSHVGIYSYLDKLPGTIALTNVPLITEWTPQVWRTRLLQQLRSMPPQVFVVELHDAKSYISGNTKDSWMHFQAWSELYSFVQSEYLPPDSSGNYMIYERRVEVK